MRTAALVATLLLASPVLASEADVVDELIRFLSIPNVASDRENIERNAAFIVEMFRARGIAAKTLRVEGAPPLVVADVTAPRATRTVAFYAHYDGQPVDPAQWTSPPWQPVVRPSGPLGPESRIVARSASDDKGPIVAMLAALDALRAAKKNPSVNLKFVFEGEEEAGSPHLGTYLEKFAADLSPDAWILCDGPVHQSRRPLVYFGARGVVSLDLTVYGPARTLHSGHYGNWAPNPIVTLTHLLAGMRDREGRVLIDGFYDDVTPLSAAERAAVQETAGFDEAIRRELALGRTEGGGTALNELILRPAMNVSGIAAGGVGEKASNSIPTEARAAVDFRLVPAQTIERVKTLVETHLARQGFFVVREIPDAATRLANPNVIRVAWGSGYRAARSDMSQPLAQKVVAAIALATGQQPVRLPSLGGSIPMYLFQQKGAPVLGLPIVNHDNNQHGANENLRVQNLRDGIAIFAKVFTDL